MIAAREKSVIIHLSHDEAVELYTILDGYDGMYQDFAQKLHETLDELTPEGD